MSNLSIINGTVVTMLLYAIPLPVNSGIYKCEIDGLIVYQQIQCSTGEKQTIVDTMESSRTKNNSTVPEFMREDLLNLEYEVYPVTLSDEQISLLVNRSKSLVTRTLKDPNSAIFRDIKLFRVKHIGGIDTFVCGEVNAKNSYGGYVGFKTFITHNSRVKEGEIDGGIEDAGRLVSVKVNGKWWKYTADDMCMIMGNVVSIK